MRTIRVTALLAFLLLLSGCASSNGPLALEEPSAPGGAMSGEADRYRQLLDADPRDARARLDYASALVRQGQYRAAEEQYSALLEQQPGNLEAMTGLAYNYAWNDQHALAERQFKQALDSAPDNFGVQKGLAFTYLRSGRSFEALKVLKSLQRQYPDDLEILAAVVTAEAGVIDGGLKRGRE